MAFEELPRDVNGDLIAEKVRFPIEIDLLGPATTDKRKIRSVALREPSASDLERCYRHACEATRSRTCFRVSRSWRRTGCFA